MTCDKVVFLHDGNRIIVENSTRLALRKAQEAFAGLADEFGFKTEEDVVNLCKEVRKENWEKSHANNDWHKYPAIRAKIKKQTANEIVSK